MRLVLPLGGLFLAVFSPWFSLIHLVAGGSAHTLVELPASTKISGVFKSALRLELPHTLFQIQAFPLGKALAFSVLLACLDKISALWLQSWWQGQWLTCWKLTCLCRALGGGGGKLWVSLACLWPCGPSARGTNRAGDDWTSVVEAHHAWIEPLTYKWGLDGRKRAPYLLAALPWNVAFAARRWEV